MNIEISSRDLREILQMFIDQARTPTMYRVEEIVFDGDTIRVKVNPDPDYDFTEDGQKAQAE